MFQYLKKKIISFLQLIHILEKKPSIPSQEEIDKTIREKQLAIFNEYIKERDLLINEYHNQYSLFLTMDKLLGDIISCFYNPGFVFSLFVLYLIWLVIKFKYEENIGVYLVSLPCIILFIFIFFFRL